MISINEGGGGVDERAQGYLSREIGDVFSEDGLLSESSGFAYRPQQQEMAVAVAEAFEQKSVLSVEAATGVGKSLAYLIESHWRI